MRLSTLRWHVYGLVGVAMLLLLLTVAATWLATLHSWAHLVAIPSASLAMVIGVSAVVTLGRWLHSTRERIRHEIRSGEQLVRLREADRIAQDLGSTTIRDLFGISLAIQSAAARHPSAAPALRAVTADMDRVLREIRSHVFNRERSIADVLAELDPELSVGPRVEGSLDRPAPLPLESFLREVLPQFAEQVLITVATTDGNLQVTIAGAPPDDPTILKETAADYAATTTYEPGHVTIEWSAPL
jgi:membrane protein implicated in regulation of membrane protease activity